MLLTHLFAASLISLTVYAGSPGGCGGIGQLPCAGTCGGSGQIPCYVFCGTPGYPSCGGGGGGCSTPGMMPCPGTCDGMNQIPCWVTCGTPGYPPCTGGMGGNGGNGPCNTNGNLPCQGTCGGYNQIPCGVICGTPGFPPCGGGGGCGMPGQPACGGCGGYNQPPCGNNNGGCGGYNQPPCGNNNGGCGGYNQPPCGNNNGGCGGYNQPPCGNNNGGCGGYNQPPCGNNNNNMGCGGFNQPPCSNGGGCGGPGQQPCSGCGGPNQPPCPGSGGCGGPNQPPCGGCGGYGQPPCGGCGGPGQPQCCGGPNQPPCGGNMGCGGPNQPPCGMGNNGMPQGILGQMYMYSQQACNMWSGVQYNGPNVNPIVNTLVGENVIAEMILDPACTNLQCFSLYQAKLQQAAYHALFGAAFAIVAAALWVFFLPCACCRCWRQCPCWFCCTESSFPSNFSGFAQMCGLIYLVACVGLGMAGVIISMNMRDASTSASAMLVCDAYTTLNNGLSGILSQGGSNYFPGFNTTANLFKWVDANLTANSAFMTNATGTLTASANLATSVTAMSNGLTALQTTLQLNNFVGDYECVFCTAALGSDGNTGLIANTSAQISNSVAFGLNGARTQLSTMIYDANMFSAVDQLQSYILTLNSSWTNTYSQWAVTNFNVVQDYLQRERDYLMPLCMCCLFPLILGILSVVLGLCRSDSYTFSNPNMRPASPVCASCAWCCTLIYAFFIFIIGTIMYLATYVGKSGCGLLQDPVNSAAGLSLKFGVSSDLVLSQIPVLVSHCLAAGADGDLIDNLLVNNRTIKQNIDYSLPMATSQSAMNAAVSGAMKITQSPNNNQTYFLNLISAMNGIGALMLPHNFTTAYNVTSGGQVYNAQTSQNSGQTNLWNTAVASSPSCLDTTYNLTLAPAGLVAGLQNMGYSNQYNGMYSIKGTQTYMNAASGSYGYSELSGSCSNSTANVSLTHHPWDELFNSRNYLMNSANTPFTCVSLNATTGTVLGSNACNLTDFDTSLRNMSTVLSSIAANVDSLGSTYTSILNGTYASVKANITDPITTLLSDMNCGFISSGYNSIVGHLCNNKVPALAGIGLMWIVYGVVSLALVFLEFFIWRHLKDNRCLWADNCSSGMGATVIQMGGAAGGPAGGRIVIMQ